MSASYKFECTICSDRFPTSFTRSSHLSKTHLDLLCRQCNRYYLSKLSLQQHYRDDPSHPTCPQCNEGFSNASALSIHRSAAHPPVQCGLCELVFKDDRLLREHFLQSDAHPTCTLCDIGFLDALSFDQHALAEHPGLYCDVCAVGFQTDQHLSSHYRQSEWKVHPTCVICDQGFKNHETYNEHMVSRHPPTPANLSPTESTPPSSISLTSSALWSHDQESMSICTKCNKEYKSGSELTQHFKRSSEHPTCVQCGTGLFDDLAFLEHKIVAHKRSQTSSPKSNHRFSPDGVFSLDEDITSPHQDPQALGLDVDNAATIKNWTNLCPPYHGPGLSNQPSPVASSYLETSLYPEEEVDELTDEFEMVPRLESDPSTTPRVSMMEQSLSYRSAAPSPQSAARSSDRSLSSVRRSEMFATPGVAESEHGSQRSQNSRRFRAPGSLGIDTTGCRTPSRPASIHEILISPRTSRPVTSLDDIAQAQAQDRMSPSPVKSVARSPRPRPPSHVHTPVERSDSSQKATPEPAAPNMAQRSSTVAPSTRSAKTGPSVNATSPWVCRICLEDPSDPTATVCGHIFCNRCIIAEFSKTLRCPVCRCSLLISLFLGNE